MRRRGSAPACVALLVVQATACSQKDESATELFTEVARASGIDCRIETGAAGDHYLIETMIGGLGWIDYEGDGDYDLYVANGHENPGDAEKPGRASNRLYENDGKGNFRDVTGQAGVGDSRYSNGVAVGDYDGDGDSDLLVTNFGRNTLYRSRGDGTFEDVTERAGLIHEGYGASAVWFDLDRDGDLDLYIARYLEYHPEFSRPCVEGGQRVYCHPRFFPGQPDLLYENTGGGVFREISAKAGVIKAGAGDGKGLGVIATDLDEDGWTDLYVANDGTPNFLWRNRGDGTFEDVALDLGVAVDENGRTQAGMGVDWGDVNGDGRFDIHITNFSSETNSLYLRLADGGFYDGVERARLGHSYTHLGFGTLLADLDLDGDLDIVVVNGHVDDKVEDYAPGGEVTYRQRPDFYRNEGRGRFALAADAGTVFRERFVGRGLASSDIDGDGDADLAIGTLDRGVLLLRNNSPRKNRYLRIRLRGTRGNRDAYGARIEVKTGSRRQLFEYQSARSYLSAVDPRVTVGVGDAARIDEITVRWPSGQVSMRKDVEVNRELVIVEGE